ncbi:MAG: formate dehydrogenase accessory sulfurtransferase FdhD [Gemmatimonadales bacterium]|nr:formate dehydrogenase accessory sulfurtransferase FdhD [Gemmatimonadales bacterium]MBT6373103.1 formate dehydrogenase accessory sulfurtransferase FdhD [Gemmatimonadales bacterium]
MRVAQYRDGAMRRRKDTLAVEEPLEIRVAWKDGGKKRVEAIAVTMRTPGHDFDLVAGFLHGEGIVSQAGDLTELTYCRGDEQQQYNIVEARLTPGVEFDLERLRRNVFTSSSCGVCGKASLEAVEAVGCALLTDSFRISGELIPQLPDFLMEGQGVFARTGGLHAAGLFDTNGKAGALREDVGRHNAVDKVLGHTVLQKGMPVSDRVLVVSGRSSFEIVQKAVMARVPMIVAVGAPSSLAVDLATRFGQTLIGFACGGGFNVYTGSERVL